MARVLCGAGVSACLMAPLTGYRRWYAPEHQMRANSWMLMTGSLGMLASTLPVQWLLPLMGWRPLFWILARIQNSGRQPIRGNSHCTGNVEASIPSEPVMSIQELARIWCSGAYQRR